MCAKVVHTSGAHRCAKRDICDVMKQVQKLGVHTKVFYTADSRSKVVVPNCGCSLQNDSILTVWDDNFKVSGGSEQKFCGYMR